MPERITLVEEQIAGNNHERHAIYINYYSEILTKLREENISGISSFEIPEENSYWRNEGANFVVEIKEIYKIPVYLCTKRNRIANHIRKYPNVPVVYLRDPETGKINTPEVLKANTIKLLSNYLLGDYSTSSEV
jgi:hypothetical protein